MWHECSLSLYSHPAFNALKPANAPFQTDSLRFNRDLMSDLMKDASEGGAKSILRSKKALLSAEGSEPGA